MKKIKTVILPLHRAREFDKEVNNLLCQGWNLINRGIKNTPGIPSEAFNTNIVQILYAELEKEGAVRYEEVTL